MFKRIYPYLIFILFAYIIWWSPDFWQPDTYFNIGDSLFPFRPVEQVSSNFYTWKDNANEGLGRNETYLSTITLYYYALMAFLKIIGLPLWICNRLFFVIPTLVLFFSSYYMILAFIDARYRRIGAVFGSIFLTTAPPLAFLDPKLHLGISGMILSFGALKRFLDKQGNHHLVTLAVGFLLMTSMPRYIYMSIILMGFFLVCWCVLDGKSRFSHNLFKVIKILGIGSVLVILLANYTLLPTVSFLLKHHSTGLMTEKEIFSDRIINTVERFRGTTSLFHAARLVNFRTDSYGYSAGHFKPLISSILIIFLFIPLVINKRIGRGFFCIMLASFFLLSLALVFGSNFYIFLMRGIPGFWIINNPMYIFIPLALLYSVLLTYSAASLLERAKGLSVIVIAGVAVLIIINNGLFFSNRIPDIKKMFIKQEIINNELGNHLPYFKLPKEYEMLSDSLPAEDRDARILVLPFSNGNMTYSWWPYKPMPEILAQITSLRPGGNSTMPSGRLRRVRDLILCGRYEEAISILRSIDYKYIFIHKDNMLNLTNPDDVELDVYLNRLSTVNSLETIIDNEYFRLYKLKQRDYNTQKYVFLISDEQDIERPEPENKLYYISKKGREFYVPKDADYLIEARVSSHLKFVRKKDKLGARFKFGKAELRDWAISPANVSFNYYTTEDRMLVLSLYFDEDEKGDEFVQMQTKNINVDLKKYPYFELAYKIEDPDAQIIQVVAGIDFDNDGKVNEYIRQIYLRPASTEWDNFRCDFFYEVKSRFPDEENYNLIFLELYPHKLWGVDCSTPERKGDYTFWIKKVVFYCLTAEEYILNDRGRAVSPAGFVFHKPIFELDGGKYWLYKRFRDKKDATRDMWFRKKVHLGKGKHYLSKLRINSFKVEWVIVEPLYTEKEPRIVFNRVNPTRYEVEVKGANVPFWLIFEEGFHDKWRLSFKQKPLNAEHNLVNGYANGWYIDPKKMELPEDFILDLYFQPQRLYNLGLGVSVLTLVGFAGFFWGYKG